MTKLMNLITNISKDKPYFGEPAFGLVIKPSGYGRFFDMGNSKKHGNTKHGLANTKLYNVWRGMKKRCLNKSNYNYHRYGGRGISICEEWMDFIVFSNWALNNGYKEGVVLDRENNDGNYEPSNCRFTTPKISGNNRGDHTYITCDGVTMNVTQWAEKLGVTDSALFNRIRKGMNDYDIIKTPFVFAKKYIYNNQEKTLSEWALLSGVHRDTLTYRLKHGLSFKEAIENIVKNTS